MDYNNLFKQKLQEQGKSINTIEGYERDLKQFQKWYQEINNNSTDFSTMTQMELVEYKKQLQDKPYTIDKNGNGKYYSVQSINRKLVSLNVLLKFMYDNKYIVELLSIEVIEDKSKKQFKGLEKSDIFQLRKEFHKGRDERDIVIFELLANTGIRVSELVDIRLNDIEISDRKGSLFIRKGKGNSTRTLPLNLDTRKAITDYLEVRGIVEGENRDYLLQGQRGRMTRKGIDSVLKKYADRVNIKVSPHQIRHTLAYKLIKNDIAITTIQDILGHNDINTTLIYTQTTEQDKEDALDKIEW